MKMDGIFKILLYGDSTTGAKTSLMQRIVYNEFTEDNLSTSGIDTLSIFMQNHLGEKVKLKFIDTAGQERFQSISQNYIKRSHCIILGYDITSRKTFESIVNIHYNTVRSIVGDFALIYLVANKIDLYEEAQVSEEEGRSYAKEKNIKFYQISCKTGEGIDILLEDIVNSLTNKFPSIKEVKKENKENKIVSNKNKTKQKNNKEIKINDNNKQKKNIKRHYINFNNSDKNYIKILEK